MGDPLLLRLSCPDCSRSLHVSLLHHSWYAASVVDLILNQAVPLALVLTMVCACLTFGCIRSASKDLLNLIEDSTKELEMTIDIVWIVNITLMFITPVE